jgi:signal transduction histidine kinase
MQAPALLRHAASHLGGPRVLALPLLRALAILLGALWVTLAPAHEPGRAIAMLLLLGFLLHSALVITALWFWTAAVLRRNLFVLLVDLGFALALIAVSGGAQSTLFLALLVVAGLQSYYYGMARGVAVAMVSAVAYLAVSWPTLEGELANVVVRLATMFGTAIGVGVLADLEASEREKVAALTSSVAQAEKLASLGTLAAGVAHELNNPIGVISSRIELMLLDADTHQLPQDVRDDLGVLQRQARRVARISQGLLSFARQSPRDRARVDLNQLVEDTFMIVEKAMTRDGVTVRRVLEPGLPPVWGDANALQQVLVNLVTNARDALPGPGVIEVRTAASPDRRAVRLLVRDTGLGIAPEVLPRIFDPFFTTKREGTGLGLSISYGIAHDHGGTIDAASRPGEGTTFTLTLPAAA